MPFPNKETQFKKGVTGNPKGRPRKLPSIEEALAETLADDDDGKTALQAILDKLLRLAINGDTKAAAILLDRAYGKAKQQIEHSGNAEAPLTLAVTVVNSLDQIPSSEAEIEEALRKEAEL